jgi:hypothetical protein
MISQGDIVTVLEIASIALEDMTMREEIAARLDLSDEDLARIAQDINDTI